MSFLQTYNFWTTAAAVISATVAVVALLGTNTDQKDFEGLRVEAEYLGDGRTRVTVPVTYQNGPNMLFAVGAVEDRTNLAQPPKPFRVKLSAVGESTNSNNKVIVYEDVRPVVCEAFGGSSACSDLTIVNLGIEAEFSRGPKPVNIYDTDPIDLM